MKNICFDFENENGFFVYFGFIYKPTFFVVKMIKYFI